MVKTSDIVWQDTQHQELLDIIEELKTSPEAGAQLVEKLTDYIAHHSINPATMSFAIILPNSLVNG